MRKLWATICNIVTIPRMSYNLNRELTELRQAVHNLRTDVTTHDHRFNLQGEAIVAIRGMIEETISFVDEHIIKDHPEHVIEDDVYAVDADEHDVNPYVETP